MRSACPGQGQTLKAVYKSLVCARVCVQTLFTVTELTSTLVVLTLCDSDRQLSAGPVLTVLTISLFHVVGAASDQFVTNLFLSKAETYKRLRDVGLMTSDLLHLAVASSWLRRHVTSSSTKHGRVVPRLYVCAACICFAVMWVLTFHI